MILKYLDKETPVTESEFAELSGADQSNWRWGYVDNIDSASCVVMYRNRDNPQINGRQRGIHAVCNVSGVGEQHYFCWDEAYFLSDEGKTIERLN